MEEIRPILVESVSISPVSYTHLGLIEATRILEGLSEIKIMELSADDVVRHPIVQKIIERYSKEDEQRRKLSLKK